MDKAQSTKHDNTSDTAVIPQVLYAGCLDSDPYHSLKSYDRIVIDGLRARGIQVRELHKEVLFGKSKNSVLRAICRHFLYPLLIKKQSRGTKDKELSIENQSRGTRHEALGTKDEARGSKNSAPSPKPQAPSPTYQAPSTKDKSQVSSLKPPSLLFISSQCYAHLIPYARCPVAITCHGLPEYFYPQDMTKAQLRRSYQRCSYLKNADLVFAVSEHVKSNLIELLDVDPEKIVVNYEGVSDIFFHEPKSLDVPWVKEIHDLRRTHFLILSVGTNLHVKNMECLLQAVALLRQQGIPAKLIKAGEKLSTNKQARGTRHEARGTKHQVRGTKDHALSTTHDGLGTKHKALSTKNQALSTTHDGLDTNLNELIIKLGLFDEIIDLGFLNEKQLNILYRHCHVLSFPSRYEGFGLPVVEAQQCGLPCVISNAASLPGVGGDGALYHDPEDGAQLAGQLLLIYEDQKLRNDLLGKGFKNTLRFSWEKHIDMLLDGI